MKLIRDKWLPMFAHARQLERELMHPLKMNYQEQLMTADYRASEILMTMSETIVLPSQVMLDLIHNIDRIDTRGWIRLPYAYLTIQFTTPIPEKDIMAHVEMNEMQKSFGFLTDAVEGILIANAEQDGAPFPPQHIFNMMNCSVLFSSTSVNRVAWKGTSKPAEPKWESFADHPRNISPESLDNKMRMIALCYAINLFLNAPNVIIRKEKPDPTVNAKRERKGKAKLPEYHTVTIQKIQTVYNESSGRKGTSHSRMYPVRGHFRKLKQFVDPIWVPNHFRGLAHGTESLRPEVYKVNPKK